MKAWLWKIYFLYFAAITVNVAAGLFIPSRPIYVFHHVLLSFDPFLGIFYFVRIMCEIMNLINLVPLYIYISKVRWLDRRIWQWALLLRIVFDLSGHYYELVILKSLFYANPAYMAQLVIWAILTILPSYYACFKYAFGKLKIWDR